MLVVFRKFIQNVRQLKQCMYFEDFLHQNKHGVTTGYNSLFCYSLPSGCEFGQADMQKLVPKDEKAGTTQGGKRSGNSKKLKYYSFSVLFVSLCRFVLKT